MCLGESLGSIKLAWRDGTCFGGCENLVLLGSGLTLGEQFDITRRCSASAGHVLRGRLRVHSCRGRRLSCWCEGHLVKQRLLLLLLSGSRRKGILLKLSRVHAVFTLRGQIRVEGIPVAHWPRNCASSGARMAARACAAEIAAGGGLELANGHYRAAARGASLRPSRTQACGHASQPTQRDTRRLRQPSD